MSRMADSIEGSDAAAVERTLAGDQDAFRVLVERHSRSLFRLAYRMSRNEEDAEEIVQDAFVRAHRKLGQFESRANFKTWLYRITVNCALDRLRKGKTEKAHREMANAPEEETEHREWENRRHEGPAPDRLLLSGSAKAREIMAQLARGQSNPELQRKAVQYLGLFGGEQARQTLAEIYAATSDASAKRQILRSYMLAGDRARLLAAAQMEKDESVRSEAIRQLGLAGGHAELEQLYQKEASPGIRRELLQAFFLSGNATKLAEAAQTEKDVELRRTAIRNLGLMNSATTSQALQNLYAKENNREIRKEVLNAFFLQGNAKALVAVARKETDPQLKKTAVAKLSLMGSKEATDFLMEILEK